MIENGKKVVVTTAHRGVFYGELEEQPTHDQVTLKGARVCVYWSASSRGFIGLASAGPQDGSRVSFACPRLRLNAVTSVIECTDEAVTRWEAGPWS